jgi:molecular chaperone DnaJ
MDTTEAYKELGLDPSVNDAQLKAGWRRLVSRWHPDRNGTSEAPLRIQRINKAYHHLCQHRSGSGDPQEDAPSSANRKNNAKPKAEKQVFEREVRLSIDDATLGCIRSLRGRFTFECRSCAGKGQRILAQACKGCQGSGAIKRASLFGWLWTKEACDDCGGEGRQREECKPCEGKGQCAVKYHHSVRLPAGVRAGDVLTVPSTRHGGLDLCLEIHVAFEAHPFFVLQDGQLRCEMPVDGYAWASNRWVDVPVPGGLQQMRLNRNALVYRLRGQGFPVAPQGLRGDYFVTVVPTFHDAEDALQQKLIERLIEASTKAADADPHSQLGQWRLRLKGWNKNARDGAPSD